MKRRFVLTDLARGHLRQILSGIADDDPQAAERLRFRIYQDFQRLSEQPGIGHYHDELLDRRFRFWNFHSYVVAYRWEVSPIRIVAVIHGRRDLVAIFNRRREE